MDENFLNEYRCNCGKLLFKGELKECKVEIKCRRCSEIKLFVFSNGTAINARNVGHNLANNIEKM
jgi:phage FluMu protein Com